MIKILGAMSDQTSETEQSNEYLVLARKYRPTNFAELKGQDALVRTLSNAIESGRIAHAFMLTGVRGVGKTTTARIVARALNCIGPDGNDGPTTEPCGVCEHCTAIAEDRHVDVLEMDAASRTGVDDIREIINSVQYTPSSARYKIYIIDEVHMLSKNAFNALLKTLEEPPEHVKFIFATTEIRKVPVTVLSRCQRFDLRRIEADVLEEYFTDLIGRENYTASPEAVALIARAADGSCRDGLSLLDQAMSLSDGEITEEQVRHMLGLADRAIVLDLVDAIMHGKSAEAMEILKQLYRAGADPMVVMQDLLEWVHFLTKARAVPETANDASLPEAERSKGAELAQKLGIPSLTRAWQILLKGMGEVQVSPLPQQAAEMVIIRMLYVAEMPDPKDLLKKLEAQGGDATPTPPNGGGKPMNGGNGAGAPMTQAVAQSEMAPQVETSPQPTSFLEVVELFGQMGEPLLQAQMKSYIHLVKFKKGMIELYLSDQNYSDLIGKMSSRLQQWTGERWIVSTVPNEGQGQQTIREVEQAEEEAVLKKIAEHPTVAAVLDAFDGAKIIDICPHLPTEEQET